MHSRSIWRGSRRFRRLAVAGLVLSLAACGDDSAERQKEAEAIAKAIEGYLATLEDPNTGAGLKHEKVTVTPSGTDKSYAVAITGLKLGGATGYGVTIGEVDYRLTPAEQSTYQVDSLKLPVEFPVIADKKTVAAVTLENGPFTAVWSSPLHNFLKLDWQVKNLVVAVPDKPDLAIHGDSLAITGQGKDNGKGRLDQTVHFTVAGLAIADKSAGDDVKLAKLENELTVTNFDSIGYQQQMDKLRGLTAKLTPKTAVAQNGATPPAAPTLTEEDRKLMAEIIAALPKTISGYASTIRLEGLSVAGRDGGAPFRIAHAGTDVAFKGIDTDKAELDLALSHDGLEVAGAAMQDPTVQALLPRSGSLSLVATDLPVPSLAEAFAKVMPQLGSDDPAQAQAAQFAMMGALMQILGQSNLKLRIDPSWLEAAKARLTADGQFSLAPNVPGMATGTVNLGLTGLDDLVAMFSAMPGDPMAANALQMLGQAQALANRETGADGKPVDKFKVDLTPQGTLEVNGKPLNNL